VKQHEVHTGISNERKKNSLEEFVVGGHPWGVDDGVDLADLNTSLEETVIGSEVPVLGGGDGGVDDGTLVGEDGLDELGLGVLVGLSALLDGDLGHVGFLDVSVLGVREAGADGGDDEGLVSEVEGLDVLEVGPVVSCNILGEGLDDGVGVVSELLVSDETGLNLSADGVLGAAHADVVTGLEGGGGGSGDLVGSELDSEEGSGVDHRVKYV